MKDNKVTLKEYAYVVGVVLFLASASTAAGIYVHSKSNKLIVEKRSQIEQLSRQLETYRTTVDSLSRVNLTLKDELTVNAIELTRYQVALDILEEENPALAVEFQQILSSKTE